MNYIETTIRQALAIAALAASGLAGCAGTAPASNELGVEDDDLQAEAAGASTGLEMPAAGDPAVNAPDGTGGSFAAAAGVNRYVLKAAGDQCVRLCGERAIIHRPEGGCGCVNTEQNRAYACDESADGLGVTTFYTIDLRPGSAGGNVGDFNGSEGDCGGEGPDVSGRIDSFHFCVGTRCTGQSFLP